jgi:hypothetical protein
MALIAAPGATQADDCVDLVATVDQDSYTLGDLVHMDLTVTNNCDYGVSFSAPTGRVNGWEVRDADTGELVFFVAYDGQAGTDWSIGAHSAGVFEDYWYPTYAGHFRITGFLVLTDGFWPAPPIYVTVSPPG